MYKLVLMGECKVGKSNIIMRYLSKTFSSTQSTIGVEFGTTCVELEDNTKI